MGTLLQFSDNSLPNLDLMGFVEESLSTINLLEEVCEDFHLLDNEEFASVFEASNSLSSIQGFFKRLGEMIKRFFEKVISLFKSKKENLPDIKNVSIEDFEEQFKYNGRKFTIDEGNKEVTLAVTKINTLLRSNVEDAQRFYFNKNNEPDNMAMDLYERKFQTGFDLNDFNDRLAFIKSQFFGGKKENYELKAEDGTPISTIKKIAEGRERYVNILEERQDELEATLKFIDKHNQSIVSKMGNVSSSSKTNYTKFIHLVGRYVSAVQSLVAAEASAMNEAQLLASAIYKEYVKELKAFKEKHNTSRLDGE